MPRLGESLSRESPARPGPGAGRLEDLWPPFLCVPGVLSSVHVSGEFPLVSQQSGDWGTACWGRGHEVGGAPELCSPSLQTSPSVHQTAAFLDPAPSQGFLLSAELASQLHHCPEPGSGWEGLSFL